MALFNIDLYLQEGERGTYCVVAKTPFALNLELTQYLPTREAALEDFAKTILNAGIVRELDVEIGKLREEIALLRDTPPKGTTESLPNVSGDRAGSGISGKPPQVRK